MGLVDSLAYPAVIALAAALGGCATVHRPADLAIENATIHAGTGEAPFRGSVTVTGGTFIAVGRSGSARRPALKTIDGRGLHLVPGLWDMHVHVAAEEGRTPDVAAFVDHGVTSVRDLGGLPAQVAATIARSAAGAERSPHVSAAILTLNGEAMAPFQRAVATREEAVAAVGELADAGAALIKVHRALKPDVLPFVIEAAHARRLRVTGHIPLGLHPLRACELGMDGIEHVGAFLEAYVSATPGAASADAVAYMLSDDARPLYDCLVARRVEVTPTLVVYRAIARKRAGNGPLPDAFIGFIADMQRIARRLHEAGVTLLAGSDTSGLDAMDIAAGASLLDELEMMQEAGIAPSEILRIATLNGARSLGLDGATGTIAPGRVADFLLVDGDPGRNVTNLRRPVAVYMGGKQVAARD